MMRFLIDATGFFVLIIGTILAVHTIYQSRKT